MNRGSIRGGGVICIRFVPILFCFLPYLFYYYYTNTQLPHSSFVISLYHQRGEGQVLLVLGVKVGRVQGLR